MLIPDLRVDPSESPSLRDALIGAVVQFELRSDGPRVHQSLLDDIRLHLEGRGPLVWREGDVLINVAFAVSSHDDHVQVEEFADACAHRLGAFVRLATTIGLLVPA